MLPAETSGQVKRKRKSQLCDDDHRFENGARFEGLLRFAAVTSGWPTTRPELRILLRATTFPAREGTCPIIRALTSGFRVFGRR